MFREEEEKVTRPWKWGSEELFLHVIQQVYVEKLIWGTKAKRHKSYILALSCIDFFPNDKHQAAGVGLGLGLVSAWLSLLFADKKPKHNIKGPRLFHFLRSRKTPIQSNCNLKGPGASMANSFALPEWGHWTM